MVVLDDVVGFTGNECRCWTQAGRLLLRLPSPRDGCALFVELVLAVIDVDVEHDVDEFLVFVLDDVKCPRARVAAPQFRPQAPPRKVLVSVVERLTLSLSLSRDVRGVG